MENKKFCYSTGFVYGFIRVCATTGYKKTTRTINISQSIKSLNSTKNHSKLTFPINLYTGTTLVNTLELKNSQQSGVKWEITGFQSNVFDNKFSEYFLPDNYNNFRMCILNIRKANGLIAWGEI